MHRFAVSANVGRRAADRPAREVAAASGIASKSANRTARPDANASGQATFDAAAAVAASVFNSQPPLSTANVGNLRRRLGDRGSFHTVATGWFALALLIAGTLLGIGGTESAKATPPANRITLPEGPLPDEPTIPPDPHALEAIKQALSGEGDVHASNPLLQDVLRVAGEKSRTRDPQHSAFGPQHAGNDWQRPTESVPFARRADPRWRAAELLLKTSRQMEKIDPEDKKRQQLVNRMRQEAVRILTQPGPQATNLPRDRANSAPSPSPDE